MNNKKNVDWKALGLNVAIVIAAIILAVASTTLIASLSKDYKDYTNNVSSYVNYYKKGAFNKAIDMSYHDMMHVRDEKDLPECIAVTEYFVAASYYELYKEDSVKGTEFAEKMRDAKSRMGDFAYMSEEIDAMFQNMEKQECGL